jgi:hypothetical protein
MTEDKTDSVSSENDEDVNQSIHRLDADKIMESIVRVSFGGFGGSILGLGQKRKLESMRVLTGAAATAAARRKRSPGPQQMNMPFTMAISCMVFCTIIETCRLTSPSSIILQSQVYDFSGEIFEKKDNKQGAIITIADFTIGVSN